MKKELISVIVPIYNVEKYICECVDSILNQTYSNIEILLIDDGSTDLSNKICDKYLNVDDRIKVFHKKNGGLSDARNYGIKKSLGKYICFIDGDDVISDDYVEKLYIGILKYNADISICGYQRFKCISDIKYIEEMQYKEVSLNEYLNNTFYYNKKEYYTVSACGKLYNKKIFKDIKYPKGRLYEDICTIAPILNRADKIVLYNQKNYYYRITENSITTSSFNEKKMDLLKSCQENLEYIKNNNLDVVNASLCILFARSVELLSMIPKNKKYKKYIYETYDVIKKYRILIIKDKNCNIKYKIAAFLSFFGKNGLIYIYKMKKKF